MNLKMLLMIVAILLAAMFGLRPVDAEVNTRLCIKPLLNFAPVGESFTVDISVFNVEFLYKWQVNMSFDPNALEFINVTEGDFLKDMPEGTLGSTRLDGLDNGWVLFGWTVQGQFQGKNGSGVLATVEFRALTIGESTLEFEGVDSTTYLLGQTSHEAPPVFFDIDFTPEDGYFVNSELFEEYGKLLALNATYNDLLQNCAQTLEDYNSLVYEYDDLDDNYIILEHELDTVQELCRVLEAAYSSLETDYEDLRSGHEANNLELGFARNMNYILLSIAIVFVVATTYLLIRKPRAS